MEARIEYWSHCCNKWIFYHSFRNKDAFDAHIKRMGLDPRYFRSNPPSEEIEESQ